MTLKKPAGVLDIIMGTILAFHFRDTAEVGHEAKT